MLEISDLRHRFGDLQAVDGISFSVQPGEIVGLVGRNGAGKTTTMRSIMGILSPQGGTVTWQGAPVTTGDRLHFGYMPEERGLYPHMPVGPQLRYFARLHGLGPQAAAQATAEWLGKLDLTDRAADKLIALSHGNQQRVQLAAAALHNPVLMVLDEPFAGLDPAAVDTMVGVVAERASHGTGVLFSSHQLDLVERLCHHVVVVDHGRVLADGTLDELRGRLPQRLRVAVAGAPRAGRRGWRVWSRWPITTRAWL